MLKPDDEYMGVDVTILMCYIYEFFHNKRCLKKAYQAGVSINKHEKNNMLSRLPTTNQFTYNTEDKDAWHSILLELQPANPH